jgi:hypothetical protein
MELELSKIYSVWGWSQGRIKESGMWGGRENEVPGMRQKKVQICTVLVT